MLKKGLLLVVALLVVGLVIAGCASTKSSAESAPDEVGSAVVDEATDTLEEIAREETRRGIRRIFGR